MPVVVLVKGQTSKSLIDATLSTQRAEDATDKAMLYGFVSAIEVVEHMPISGATDKVMLHGLVSEARS
jgi:hypothetical protein